MDLREQCDQLLAQRVAKETTSQADYKHEQAQLAKECKAAELRKKDRIAQEHLDQWKEDQEKLKRIEAKEHKVQARKLQKATEQREVEEEETALQLLQAQRVQLHEIQDKRKEAMEVEKIR